jgi:hypothetical protein
VTKLVELEQDSDKQVNDDGSTWLLHTSHSEHEPMSLFKAQELTEDCTLSYEIAIAGTVSPTREYESIDTSGFHKI